MQIKLPAIGILAAIAVQAQAIDFITTNTYQVTPEQTFADEQWVASGAAETEGLFKNDLLITSGSKLLLNGTYEGNIWGLAGGAATLGGQCERNVRLAGKSVQIDGNVDGNLLAMAETIMVTTNAVIGGNARLIGSSIVLEGEIKGSATISSARVITLGGRIEGNASVTAPDILLSRDTHIAGNLSYTANKELVPDEGMVGGMLERISPKAPPLFSLDRLASRSLWFLAALLAGMPFIALFPMTTAMASQFIRKSPWKCLWVGFLASIALPVIALMCASALIGMPLGILILTTWGAMFYLSRIIMALVLGSLILRSAGTSMNRVLAAMALGLAIIYIATMFPPIALTVQMIVVCMGMGSLILALLQKRRLIIQVPNELKQLEKLRDEEYNPEENSK